MTLRGFARTLLFLLVLMDLFLLGACSWFTAKRVTEADRIQILRRFRDAIQGAGGTQVWVKETPKAGIPSAQVDIPIEVLAVPAAFNAVLSAMKQESARADLQIRIKEARTRDRWRAAEVRVSRRDQMLGRWRLREIRQLCRAAIVIDDLGQDLEAARKLLALPYPLTFSILPRLRWSTETAEEAHRAGREVMLHLPLEPELDSAATAGRGEIKVGMTRGQVARILEADLASTPHIAGVNNHMGSRASTSPALMATVMELLAERRLYFIDSRTTPASVAFEVARRQGLPTFYRSVFLDDTETVAYTLGQLREFRRAVEEQGAALAVGHPYPSTVTALARFLPELERSDVQLVPASELLHLPEVAHLWPPSRIAP